MLSPGSIQLLQALVDYLRLASLASVRFDTGAIIYYKV
jgi:hypothetical protein